MNCPHCDLKLQVIETRDAAEAKGRMSYLKEALLLGDMVVRIRKCPKCGYRVITTEKIERKLFLPRSRL